MYLIWVILNFFWAPKHNSRAQDLWTSFLYLLSDPVVTKWWAWSPDGQGERRLRLGGVWPCAIANLVSSPMIWTVWGPHRFPPESLPDVKFGVSARSVPGFYVVSHLNSEWLCFPVGIFPWFRDINSIHSTCRHFRREGWSSLLPEAKKLLYFHSFGASWSQSIPGPSLPPFCPSFRPPGARKLRRLPLTFGSGKSENWSNNN